MKISHSVIHLFSYSVILLFSICSALAQTKKIENTDSFIKQLEQNAFSVKSIESDFKQIKHVGAFNKDIISSGKFYYKASDKIRLNYVKPSPYLIVINADKIKIESEGKKNVMNLKDNKQMKEMQRMLTACMTGNFSGLTNDYLIEVNDDGQFYLVNVKPVNDNIKKYVTKYDIYLNRKDMSVNKLRISETDTDYTEYAFSNKKINTLNNDALFKI